MPRWDFALTDAQGNTLTDLAEATNRSVSAIRNGVPEVTATISHEDECGSVLLTALDSGIPLLKGYRNGVLRFHGYLAPFQETLDEGATLDLTFRGPFGQLIGDGDSRGWYTEAAATSGTADAVALANIFFAVALANGFTRIQAGTTQTTSSQSVDYSYASIGQVIQDLSALDGGYDFEVAPLDAYPAIGQLNFYASQGSDKPSAIFEYGPDTLANVKTVTRQTAPPINHVFVVGATPTGSPTLTSTQNDNTSQAAYGIWPVQASAPDCQTQPHLDNYAKSLLRAKPIRTVSFTPDPTLAPMPWDDFWIGDTVRFRGKRSGFSENVSIRVDDIKILIDDEGNEVFDLTPDVPVSTPPVTFAGDTYGPAPVGQYGGWHRSSSVVNNPGSRARRGGAGGHIRGEVVGQ